MVNTSDHSYVKAKYGSDIRKVVLSRNEISLFDSLERWVRATFDIPEHLAVRVKYVDSDGDLVTLTNDQDVQVALRTETSLYLHIFSNGDDVRAEVAKVNQEFTSLKNTLDRLSLLLEENVAHFDISNRENSNVVSSDSHVHQAESVATIHPSLHEQVDHNGISHLVSSDLKEEAVEDHLNTSARDLNQSAHQFEDIPIDQPSHFDGFHANGNYGAPPQGPPLNNFTPGPPNFANGASPPSLPSFPNANGAPPVSGPPPSFQQNEGRSASTTPGFPPQLPPQQFQPPPPQEFRQSTPQGIQNNFQPPPAAGFAPPVKSFPNQPATPQHDQQIQQFQPPNSQFGPPPTSQFAPPPAQFGPPPTQFGGAPPQRFGPPPPTSQTPQFGAPAQPGGFQPPPLGPPPANFGSAPPAGPGGIANPFARPQLAQGQRPPGNYNY